MPEQLPSICFVALNAFPVLAGDAAIRSIGGAELQQVLVGRALAERGYPVSMVCLDYGQEDPAELDGITVHRAFRPEEGIPVLRFVWPRLTSIWNCLAKADADIYYQRAAGMLTGVVAEFCRRHARKSVYAAAGNPDFERNTPRIRFARDRWIYEYGLRRVDSVLAQNAEQARLCKSNFGRDAVIVPNCYPVQARRGAERGREVLWVSTLRGLKRPALFLDLAESLPQHRFRMIGGPGRGEERLYRAIEARAATIGNLDFLGFVPYADVGRHFEEAALVVNTSESEGFPNTFLQAWALSVPTLSFIDSGARYRGAPLGRRVDTVSEMTQCVDTWLTDEAERARAGQRCRAYVRQSHSLSGVLDRYEEIFKQLVRGGD